MQYTTITRILYVIQVLDSVYNVTYAASELYTHIHCRFSIIFWCIAFNCKNQTIFVQLLTKVRFSFRRCICMVAYVKYVIIRYVIAMIFHFYSVYYCSMSSSILYKNNTEMREGMG